MALFDFFKRKRKVEKEKEKQKKSSFAKVTEDKEKQIKKTEKVSVAPKAEKPAKPSKIIKGFSYEVIREPHISEKSTNLSEKGKYIFKVGAGANKPEIKKAVEGTYGVDVLSVKVIKIPKKKRRLGRIEGFKKGHTKAVVTVKEGQTIEVL